jgi:hypothetical protein
MTGVVVPAMARATGINRGYDWDRQRLTRGRALCHTFSFSLADAGFDLPIYSDSVDMAVANDNGGIHVDLRVPSADASAVFRFKSWKDRSGLCRAMIPIEVNISAGAGAEDFEGELDVRLGTRGSSVMVERISNIQVELRNAWVGTSSGLLNVIADLGIFIWDLFDRSCSGFDDCVNQELNAQLQRQSALINDLSEMVNESLTLAMAVNGGVSQDDYHLFYGVSLIDLQTSESDNTFQTHWDVSLASDVATDACASGLTMGWLPTSHSTAPVTSHAIEAELPINLINQMTYILGKQGLFCVPLPVPGFGTIEVEPSGMVSAYAPPGFLEPQNTLVLELPVRGSVDSLGATGDVVATLKIVGQLETDCDEGLYFRTDRVDVTDVSGTLTNALFTIDAADLESDIQDAVDTHVTPLIEDITLLPQVSNLHSSGDVQLHVGRVLVQNGQVVIGFDFGDTCPTSGVGLPPGGDGPGFPDFDIFQPGDDDDDDQTDPGGPGSDIDDPNDVEDPFNP